MIAAWIAAAVLAADVPPPGSSLDAVPDSRRATAADSTVYRGDRGELRVSPPRFEDGDITVDAQLDEPHWARAAVLTGFTQYEPAEGAEASQATEVLVFYTSEAIYFGFRVHDTEPEGILAHRTERDRSVTDDWVRIMLDTFHDERQAYTFFVNPLGIQTDGHWREELPPLGGSPTGPRVDFNPDYIWQSDGRVTDEGWVAEIRIPYVSIRFQEAPVQTWGLQIARGVTRNGFKMSWAPLTLDVSSVLAQSGELVGLRGLEPQKLMELNPVATGKRTGRDVNGSFVQEDFDPEFGLNARYGITQNLVLDGTYNPDFSQVEADVDQIQVNERFALFFPEKRPFFLDGTEIFQTTQRLVHTRQIVDPVAGAKLTGKVGAFNVAYLGAVDESPTTLFGGSHDAVFNLFRLRRDVGDGSTVGLLYTDRRLAGGDTSNRVLSSDLRLLFGGRYTLESQLTGSWTEQGEEADDPRLRPMLTLNLRRSGQRFSFRVNLEDVHPEFRTRSGFVRRVGDTHLLGAVNFTRFGEPGALLERYGVEVRSINFFQHDAFWSGRPPFEREIEVQPSLSFRDDRNVSLIFRHGIFEFRPEQFTGYETLGPEGEPAPFPTPPDLRHMLAVGMIPNVRLSEAAQLRGRIFWREVPLFQEGSRGIELLFGPSLSYRPTRALDLDLGYTWARLWRSVDASVYSTVNLARLRSQYHFTETLLARVIGQYDLERRAALRAPTTARPILIDGELAGEDERGSFQAQVLLQYEPSPGTIFFVGVSRVMEGGYSYRLSRMDPTSEGLFMKLSYLFRM